MSGRTPPSGQYDTATAFSEPGQGQVVKRPNPRDKAIEELGNLLRNHEVQAPTVAKPTLGKQDLLTGLLPTLLLGLMNKDAGAVYASGYLGAKQQDAQRRTQQSQIDAERANQEYEQRLRAAQFQVANAADSSGNIPDGDGENGTSPYSSPDPVGNSVLQKAEKLFSEAPWSQFEYARGVDLAPSLPGLLDTDGYALLRAYGAADESYANAVRTLEDPKSTADPVKANQDLNRAQVKLRSRIEELYREAQELHKLTGSADGANGERVRAAEENLRQLIRWLESAFKALRSNVLSWRERAGLLPDGGTSKGTPRRPSVR